MGIRGHKYVLLLVLLGSPSIRIEYPRATGHEVIPSAVATFNVRDLLPATTNTSRSPIYLDNTQLVLLAV